MSIATVTYHELPPLNSWLPEAAASAAFDASTNAAHEMVFAPDAHRQPVSSSVVGSSAEWTAMSFAETDTTSMSPAAGWATMGGMETTHDFSPMLYGGAPDPRPAGGGKKRGGGSRGQASVSTTSVLAPEELCLVCGDKASGYHYNALTCEGCKGFFRRSITRKAVYYCKYGGHCDIDMYMRRKCQCCRLRKCMDIGMRPELVIPEDQCRIKREAKMKIRNGLAAAAAAVDERKPSCSPPQVTSTEPADSQQAGMTAEQRELTSRIVAYQQQFDMPSDEALSKLSTFTDPGSQQTQPFQHLAELTILYVQLIVEFTKNLPGFSTLSPEDQLTLQKACATEVLMVRMARRYDAQTDAIVLGNQSTSWAYSRDAYRQAGIGSLTDAIFDFAKSMSKLKVDNAEYALLTAITIFADRPNLQDPKKVEDIQEVYTSTLQAYMDAQRPRNRTVFARLLMKLTDLRTLGSEHADMLCAAWQLDAADAGARRRAAAARTNNVHIKVEPLRAAVARAADDSQQPSADVLQQAVISSFPEFCDRAAAPR